MSYKNFDPQESRHWSQSIRAMMDEMLQRSFVGYRGAHTWAPGINLYEGAAGLLVCVDLAGMSPTDIDVSCAGPTRLTISGARPHPRLPEGQPVHNLHILEIDEGPFSRTIELPIAVDPERVAARYADGYLWVILPRMGAAHGGR
ncbi:MAG: Hsp20/alpha crystallin family protein [Planctomycetia bacterium]|nr:MAG: Hsp20/alpha crystallin family protein [Planctomycetia bacterium]